MWFTGLIPCTNDCSFLSRLFHELEFGNNSIDDHMETTETDNDGVDFIGEDNLTCFDKKLVKR